jgi:hypothetical protein
VSFILYPPDHEGPTPNGTKGNIYEWTASQMEKGDTCWFRKKVTLHSRTPWRRGTFLSSYYYDGVIASVYEDDPDDLIRHSLFLDLGDQISATDPSAESELAAASGPGCEA